MSFLELIIDYKKLLNNGYNERFLNQSLHTMLVSTILSIFNDSYCINFNYEHIEKI